MRVLIVEDEVDLANTLRKALDEELFAVDVAHDGAEGGFLLAEVDYDVVVLDLMIPKRSGSALLEEIRNAGSRTPVLILTARDAVEDRVKALDLGADDYLTKPFAIAELVARLRALIRRSAGNPSPVLTLGEISIDRSSRTVSRNGVAIPLTAREYSILELMARNPGTLVTRTVICEQIYCESAEIFSNVVDVHVAALRRKLGAAFIQTRRGQGYIINA